MPESPAISDHGQRPVNSRIDASIRRDSLEFHLPQQGLYPGTIFGIIFTILWNATLWWMLGSDLKEDQIVWKEYYKILQLWPAGKLFVVGLFVVIGLALIPLIIHFIRLRVSLMMDCTSVILTENGLWHRSRSHRLVEVKHVTLRYDPEYGQDVCDVAIEFQDGKAFKLGWLLTLEERVWILHEIRTFIKEKGVL